MVIENDVISYLDSGTVDHYGNIDLKQALDHLPEKYRTVIILRFFEDLKIEEIAEILNENTNTIKTRLYKALEKLRLQLRDKEEV